MSKYSTRYKSRKNKRNSKVNKTRRLKRNKLTRRKHKKHMRKKKQKKTKRRNVNAGRPPPYTKTELLDAIRGLDFNRHRALTEDNPSVEKFDQLINLLKYVNWLHSIDTFSGDKLQEYIIKTDLIDIVNLLYHAHNKDNTYDEALDTIILNLAGLAMTGIPTEQQDQYNYGKEEGKDDDYIYFQDPTEYMIRIYFNTLYQRIESVVYDMPTLPLPDNWKTRLN